jgi:hypothetical protein
MIIKIHNGICAKCNQPFSKEIKWGHIPKFCSRVCSNSRSHSKDTIEKMSEWAKSNPRGVAAYKNIKTSANTKDPNKWITIECPTCKLPFEKYKSETSRKYCSSKCRVSGGYRKESFRHGIKGYYCNIHCDSTWELAFLIYHLDHNNDIQRHPVQRTYIDVSGDHRNYYPDFKVNGKLYEIKGRLTDNDLCKIQCNPDVILLTENELQPIFNYVCHTYNVSKSNIRKLYHIFDKSGSPTGN